jgi:hypothetical protein
MVHINIHHHPNNLFKELGPCTFNYNYQVHGRPMFLPFWNCSMNQQHLPFLTTTQSNMRSFIIPAHVCLFPFEQFIKQQMVHLQNSILEHLHHHTFFNMFFDGIFEAHHAQILSCFRPRANVWLIIQLIFPTFQLFSLIFSTVLRTQFRLPHLSIASLLRCMCPNPIDPTGIHLLHCAHGNERTWTYDIILDIFVAIMRDVGFHVGW